MAGNSIRIHDQSISPGERQVVMLPMPGLYGCAPLEMPVHVIRGKETGPSLCVTSTVHGDEVNGIEIIRRILKKPALKRLHGTLIAVPIVNMYGFLYQDRYLLDRRDLNRSFPGSEKGSLAARLAHLLSSEVLKHATHCIDLHTGSLHRSNLPQIRTNIDDKQMYEMAKAFNVPVIFNSKMLEGSLREHVTIGRNIPALLYEAGESLRFDELSIKTGVRGILNVMCALNMLATKKTRISSCSAVARSGYWVRSSHSGIFQPKVRLGQSVEKGQTLATIGNPASIQEYNLNSPISGIIIGKNNLPVVYAGAALFHIATFKDVDIVAEHIENLQEDFDGSLTG